MSHYYTNDPSLNSKDIRVEYDFKGYRLKLRSDLGVFSKNRVDFGSNILLNAIKNIDFDGKKMIDVGCGYGILGLALAKAHSKSTVHLVDVNERAIELAKINASNNNISNVHIYVSNAYSEVNEKFDFIVTNPPIRAGKAVVHEIVLGGYDKLNVGGKIFVVIQKKQGAPSLFDKMTEIFGNTTILEKENGYYVICGEKI